MGYMRHHAIIVTSYSDKAINWAHQKAKEFGLIYSELLESPVNGYKNFFIAPDGSKEGWPDSDDGDSKRALFTSKLNDYRYSDGSSPLDWVEVQFGDENGDQRILKTDSDVKTGDDYSGATLADDN